MFRDGTDEYAGKRLLFAGPANAAGFERIYMRSAAPGWDPPRVIALRDANGSYHWPGVSGDFALMFLDRIPQGEEAEARRDREAAEKVASYEATGAGWVSVEEANAINAACEV